MGTALAFISQAYIWLKSTWVGRMFLNWLEKKAIAIGKEFLYYAKLVIKKIWRKQVQKGSVEKVENAFKNIDKTADEKGKAYEDFNNRGR